MTDPGRAAADRSSRATVASEAALLLLNGTAVIGLTRLFLGHRFLGPALVALVVSHVVAAVARRARLPVAVAFAASAIAMVLTLGWVIEPATTRWALPLSRTWRVSLNDLSGAWHQFSVAVAPVRATRGFVLGVAIATWSAAFLSDGAAFRLGITFEATIPSLTMVGFSAALARDRQAAAAVAELGALLVFALTRSIEGHHRSSTWFHGGTGRVSASLARWGIVLAAATTGLAALLGPNLPGAKAEALVAWRTTDQGGAGPGTRVTVSPLVDIRTRLVDQSQVEAFTVAADQPEYWRLTELDRFDGHLWSSLGSYRSSTAELSPPPPNGTPVHQRYQIEALASIWLPAAYLPRHISGARHVRYDDNSASLLTDGKTSDRLRYEVDSSVPVVTAADLTNVASAGAGLDARYLDLPADFPPEVAALARRVAPPDLSPYHRALALQSFFLGPRFTYDLSGTPAGHDEDALRRFLFVTRRGYCEQFAGSYAAMARAIGLPSRVAVGFTPGERDPNGVYHVRGMHAHAWPEVWFPHYGWLAFEPTPGRGQASAESYTNVAPAQAESGSGTGAGGAGATVAGGTGAPPPSTTPRPATAPTPPVRAGHRRGAPVGRSWWRDLLVVMAAAVGGAAVLAGGVPMVRSWRRRRRRAAAVTPAARVLVAWADAAESLARSGLRRQGAETAASYAARAGRRVTSAAPALHELAAALDAAAYGVGPVPEPVATEAERAARTVDTCVRAGLRPAERLWRAVDPRSLSG